MRVTLPRLAAAVVFVVAGCADATDPGGIAAETVVIDETSSTTTAPADDSDDDGPGTTEPPVTEPAVTEPTITEPAVTEPTITEPPVAEPAVTEPPTGPRTEADDIESCVVVFDVFNDSVQVAATNNSSEVSTYFLDVVVLDGSGARIDDSVMIIDALRPGEFTVEEGGFFDDLPDDAVCEVRDVDRTADRTEPDELDDVQGCVITGADFADDFEAEITVVNDSSETSDYLITVAFYQADGLRLGTGSASLNSVITGETATTDAFTIVDFIDNATCEVVAVSRFAS